MQLNAGAGHEAFCSGGDQSVRGEGGYVGADKVPRLNVLDLQARGLGVFGGGKNWHAGGSVCCFNCRFDPNFGDTSSTLLTTGAKLTAWSSFLLYIFWTNAEQHFKLQSQIHRLSCLPAHHRCRFGGCPNQLWRWWPGMQWAAAIRCRWSAISRCALPCMIYVQ